MALPFNKKPDSNSSKRDGVVSVKKKDVLIIEDSVAISVLIRDFLQKMDYKKVHMCDSGKTGIQTFKDLTKDDDSPIVLLDYELPDMNADEIMSRLFKIKPNAKIILETAEERTSKNIKELLRKGAYLFLQKPIRFEDLKDAFGILEDEDRVLDVGSTDVLEKIESLLKSSSQVSIARISEYNKIENEITKNYLKDLEKNGKVVQIGDIKEVSCNLCGSVRIRQNFHCPSCNTEDFVQDKLIEHFTCGNVSLASSYDNDICPKCHKEIKIVGVDYKTIDNYYFCKNCGNKFPELALMYHCFRCDNKFKLEQAHWITSDLFRSSSAGN